MAEILLIIGIVVLFCCLVLTLIALCFVSGIFERVEVGTGKPPIGKVVIAYKFATGPYSECGQYFTEVTACTPSGYKCLGIYYDDPKKVEAQKLRYAVATVLSENDEPINEEVQRKLLDAGYKLFTLPEVSYSVNCTFPYRTSLSIFIAVFKVYPKLGTYVNEHKLCAHPFLEVYIDSKIHFMGPLMKQNEFYVDEARERMEENEDEIEDDYDESGQESRETSHFGTESFIDEDQEDLDDEFLEDRNSEIKDASPSEAGNTVKDQCAVSEGHVMNSEEQNQADVFAAGINFQDSGFSSEQAASPEISPTKPEMDFSTPTDGNESGSSFEEISIESDELSQKKENIQAVRE